MVNLKINDIPVTVPEGTTVLEAARAAGFKIPSLCYLKDVNEIGSCRICVVEVKGARSLMASCVYPVSEGMEVYTNTPKVRHSRQLSLELILSNHRMDCLTCARNAHCELRDLAARCNAISAKLDGCQCNICINYGGRAEIVHAARGFARDCLMGITDPGTLTEEGFERYLYSAGIPSPDLLIRPGGEQRLSNFLLWQCAYSEFYYTDVLWPDFSKEELHRAIASYQNRDRRFGGV